VSAEVGSHAVERVSERVDGVEDELNLRLLDVDFGRQHLTARASTTRQRLCLQFTWM